jgi:putative ABC transport system permease protein
VITDLKQSIRAIARWRWGAVTAILTLAIGIGTTTGLYALGRVLVAGLPGVPDVQQLARVYASSLSLGVERSPVALHEFDTTLSRATSFAAIGAYAETDATIGSAPDARGIRAGMASPSFFTAMGVPPVEGRVFVPADLDSSQPVVVLSHALWRREFPHGRLANATIAVDGINRAVIGVMPPEFSYSFVGIGADLWLPLGRAWREAPAIVSVYARLRPGVGWPAAAAELSGLSRGREHWTWRAIPIGEDTRRRALGAYGFTLGPALLVLLIACVNVACLLMARGLERERELSVRRALGATRARVVRLLLAESFVLAIISGALGVALAAAILRSIASALAAVQPSLAGRIAVDAGLLPVALAASAVACLLFGAAPALRLSRRDVAASLNGVPAVHRIEIAGYGGRDAVVFAEIASAVGLVVWTAMLFTLFGAMRQVTTTFSADRIVAMRVPARDAHQIAERVGAVPGVARVTMSSGMLGGLGSRTAAVRVETETGAAIVMSRVPVGDGFLETLGIPVLRGRSFDAGEIRAAGGAAILSESAARQLAPAGDVLGMRIRVSGAERAAILVVIGVCRDAIDYGSLSNIGLIPPDIYVPYDAAATAGVVLLARVSTDPHRTLRAIAAAARAPAGSPPARPGVLADEAQFGDRPGSGMIVAEMLGAFAVLTLLLAASGVFAVISHSVGQRTREFGVRLALGASPRGVLGMVLARETKLIAAAVGCGVIFTMALTRALFVELAALGAARPSTWMTALALAVAAAAIACALATWRIVRLDPATVLRRH